MKLAINTIPRLTPGVFICVIFKYTLMTIYNVRLTTFSCDDGHGEDNYFEFATREQAESFASTYGDDPTEVAVFATEKVDYPDIPF